MLTLITHRWPADQEHITRAAQRLRQGAVIAFPTDTVYAVGARALDPSAVRRLYAIKRRPESQPVVLLVADPGQLRGWAVVTERAEALMARFWPGPLTLVLPRRAGGPIVGAAGPTIAFRAPDNRVALQLLRALAEPIASSSANWAGAPPPVDADGVFKSLEHEIDLILDGGTTPLGKPSTILDFSADEPRILREGTISKDELLRPS